MPMVVPKIKVAFPFVYMFFTMLKKSNYAQINASIMDATLAEAEK